MSFIDVYWGRPGGGEIRGPKKRLAEPGIRCLPGQNEYAQK
jgi:hypothetical protein